jgi:metal-responsive CopG/Arc/MetJ family transcriptional regulator
MAVLKTDIKRITLSIPKSFLNDLDNHLKNFALTDRSRWILDAAKEKLSQEKIQLHEMREENEHTD